MCYLTIANANHVRVKLCLISDIAAMAAAFNLHWFLQRNGSVLTTPSDCRNFAKQFYFITTRLLPWVSQRGGASTNFKLLCRPVSAILSMSSMRITANLSGRSETVTAP
jgi:hypothetical protein